MPAAAARRGNNNFVRVTRSSTAQSAERVSGSISSDTDVINGSTSQGGSQVSSPSYRSVLLSNSGSIGEERPDRVRSLRSSSIPTATFSQTSLRDSLRAERGTGSPPHTASAVGALAEGNLEAAEDGLLRFSPSDNVYPGQFMPRKFLRSADQWTYGYIGKYFSYKDLRSDGDDFAEDNPTNLFKILGVALYHNVDFIPLSPKKGTYSRSQLYFVAVSFDLQQQWDVYPVKSFNLS